MVKKRWNKATPKQAGKAPNIGDPSLLPWTSADKTLASTASRVLSPAAAIKGLDYFHSL